MIPISRCRLLIPFFLMGTACSIFEPEGSLNLNDTEGTFESPVIVNEINTNKRLYKSEVHFVQIDEYTQQLALALSKQLSNMHLDEIIVVTPFVHGANTTTDVDNLGREISSYLINDLVELGIATSDSGLSSSVRKNDFGGIDFSVEQLKTFSDLDVSHVLSGNMLRTKNGLMLNARVLDLKSGSLVASSSKLLPNIVLNGLL